MIATPIVIVDSTIAHAWGVASARELIADR
jgi:hypothetical protein